MKHAKAWALPFATGLVVLSALLLPPQISALRDRQTLGAIHKELLAQEELTIREATLAEKLTLLVRAIRYPDLAVYSTTHPAGARAARVGAGRGRTAPKRGLPPCLGRSAPGL